jgi:hypothetical protein
VIDPVARLPKLQLAPSNDVASYDVMPAKTIINGALLIEKDGFYWAIQSPRELARFEEINSDM